MANMHVPALVDAVVRLLAPRNGETYVDGTYGGGGHTRAILDTADARVIALDRDPEAIARARSHANDDPRVIPAHGRFGNLDAIASRCGYDAVDGVILDLGLSSFQLETAGRGFSFMQDGPIDMRMDTEGIDAGHVINTARENELARIFRILGEERAARSLASAIALRRASGPITTTSELADIASKNLGLKGTGRIHPATKCFQALRLYVNDELPELARALSAAERIIRPGGRLVVISFHSLEDRMVKSFLRTRSGLAARPSRHVPQVNTPSARSASFQMTVQRAVRPSPEEVNSNPRSRSARLRWAIRRNAPAWSNSAHLPEKLPTLPATGARA